MDQSSLEVIIRATLLRHLPPPVLPVIRANQPGSTGREDGIYFFLVNDGKVGWQQRKYPDMQKLVETQINESMYQFYSLVSNEAHGTALDVVNRVRMVISSLPMVEDLRRQGLGVQRPSNVLSPVFVNDRDQYDSNPNFTVIFTHPSSLEISVPFTTEVHSGFQRF